MHCKAHLRRGTGERTKVLAWSVYPNCLIWLPPRLPAHRSVARNSNGWLLAAPPEPLTGRKARARRARLVVNPYAEEISDEKTS